MLFDYKTEKKQQFMNELKILLGFYYKLGL